MICDHPDCTARTTDRCDACDIPFCLRHLYPDGRGRFCGPCRNARWRKGIERDALIVFAFPFVGPLLPLLNEYDTDPTATDVKVGFVIGVVMAVVLGVRLAIKWRRGPPVPDAPRRPRR